ncbi:helix-turn-helix domain-containing protein [Klebsiella quasipneumoniae]|uniref:helix-turn-helix domain-containing protein n=1 Tax=Klebsiella quasipneumoniae TaxID=1463165 RepID=UPI00352AB15A
MNIQGNASEAVVFLSKALEEEGRHNIIISSIKQKIYFSDEDESWIYILKSGSVNVCRISDDMVLLNIEAPAIIGMTSLFKKQYYHYLVTTANTTMIRVKTKDSFNIIERKNLWKQACEIVCNASQYYYKRDELVYASNVYDIIKNHLEIIWQMPEDARCKVSVFEYILSRTGISRSSLNKILKDLFKGGYIVMKRGKLLAMKKLPSKY